MAQNLGAGRMPVRQAQAKGDDVARSPQFEWLARAGLVARGVIYAIIGVLAIKLALGDGGKTTNQQGALETIAKQPFGKALLILMAVGLAGYAIWRLVRAAIGHGPEASDDAKERVAGLASGIAYALLCVTAVSILIGSGRRLGRTRARRPAACWTGRAGRSSWASPAWSSIGVGPRAGLQGDQEEVPRAVQDRADERGRRAGLHGAGRLRSPRAHGRVRAHRLLPRPGRDRLRPGQGGGPRRSAEPRSSRRPTVRSCSASSRPG